MKMTRVLLALALMCGLTGVANAFQIVVIDPFSTFPIFTAPFAVTFTPCAAGQLPTDAVGSYTGCFSGVNRTGKDWLGIDLVFGNSAALASQTAVCALDGGPDLYQSIDCASSTASLYVIKFDDGNVPNNGNFLIAESGVDPASFPPISASVTTSTPEPASLLLLSTGILASGFFFVRRRPIALYASTS